MNEISMVEKYIREREPSDVYEVKEIDRRLSRPFIKPHFIVCDLGGGFGIDVLPFAEISSHSILLEINIRGLKSVYFTGKELGLGSKLDLIMASILNLPYRDEVFNLVSSFSVLDHVAGVDSCQNAIKEMSRVTRNLGYVVVTIPNKLFIIGRITRSLIQLLGNPYLEIHFTPQEIKDYIIKSELTPLLFDVKYPTKIGEGIIKHHLPFIIGKFPSKLLLSFIHICEKIFDWAERGPLKIFGPRMGYLCQKKTV